MARRKYRTVIAKRVTLEFVYDPMTGGVPCDEDLRGPILDALAGIVLHGAVVSVETEPRKVPIGESQA